MSDENTDHFVEALAGFELFGNPLQPYSPSRKVAAQAMGMLYPFVGDSGAAQMERTNTYPGMILDMAICLWLCTLDNSIDQTREQVKAGEWNPSKAMRSPDLAREAAIVWATENDMVDATGDGFSDAMQVFFAIVTGVEASQFKLQVDGKDPEPSESEGDGPKV